MKKNTEAQQETQQTANFFDNDYELIEFIRRASAEEVCTYTKQSDSLESIGIYEDDKLIVRNVKKNDENQITLWHHKEEGYLIGYAYDNFGDISINYLCGVERHKRKDIQLIGVVVGIVKRFDARNPNLNSRQHLAEITAVCAECRKQISGTEKFIKAEGWELKKDKAVCITCDLFGGAK
jgi:hypothetical protein